MANQSPVNNYASQLIRKDVQNLSHNNYRQNICRGNVYTPIQNNSHQTGTVNCRKSKSRGFLGSSKMARQVANYDFDDDSEFLQLDDTNWNVNFNAYGPNGGKTALHQKQYLKTLDNHSLSKLKEQFIQANCQFVVSNLVDCTGFLVDPDMLVPWDIIEQIKFPSSEIPECPICLYPPTTPKMTKCGHIYCWPCALQYLAYISEEDLVKQANCGPTVRSSPRSKKCAICAEHFYPEDLRSLSVRPVKQIKPGENIHMRLMRKNKGCTQVLAAEQWYTLQKDDLTLPLSPCYDSEATVYSKILQASQTELLAIVEQEKCELLEALKDDEFGFVALAVEYLGKRIESILAASDAVATPQLERMDPQSAPDLAALTACSPPEGLDPPSASAGSNARRAKRTSASEEPAYYFYQSADGQHIYLNSINWRCLVQEAGGDSTRCPLELNCPVLQMDAYSMSAAQRKKHPYLNHLPLSTTLWEVELDLRPPLVSRETLKKFERELSKRRALRRSRDRKERQHSRRAEEAERRLVGFPVDTVLLPSAMNDIRVNVEDPTFTEADPPLPQASAAVSPSTDMPRNRSFADMLRTSGTRNGSARGAWSSSTTRKPDMTDTKPKSSEKADADEDCEEGGAPPPAAMDLGALLEAQMRFGGGSKQSKKKKRAAKINKTP